MNTQEMIYGIEYFGLDCNISTESATDIANAIKEKIKVIKEKVIKVINHVLEWLKEKFFKFLKIKTVDIYEDNYKNGNALLKQIEASGTTSRYMERILAKLDLVYGAQSNDFSELREMIKTKMTALQDIEKSEQYTNLSNKNGTIIKISPSAYSKQRQAFNEELQSMKALLNKLNMLYDNMEVQIVALCSEVAHLNIYRLMLQINIIDKVMASCVHMYHGDGQVENFNLKALPA